MAKTHETDPAHEDDTEAANAEAYMAETFGESITRVEGGTEVMAIGYGPNAFTVRVDMDPEAVQGRILSRLFQAETLDQAFDTWESKASEHLAGRSFRIDGVRWGVYTTDEDRQIPLAEVTAVDLKSGEVDNWVTTAPNLTGFLALAETKGWLPFEAKVIGTKTRRGFTTLRFGRVG